jgi:hypothetical protein
VPQQVPDNAIKITRFPCSKEQGIVDHAAGKFNLAVREEQETTREPSGDYFTCIANG